MCSRCIFRTGNCKRNSIVCQFGSFLLKKRRYFPDIQRLINTIDATLQFYGKTSTVENAINSGNPSVDLDPYLENMESLQQAIIFFETHPNYRSQTDNMRITLDTGYTMLEKAYKNFLLKNSITVDPAPFVKNELTPRLSEIKIMTDEEPIIKIGVWLLKQPRVPNNFLGYYSEIRGAQILKNIKSIAEAQKSSQLASRSKL